MGTLFSHSYPWFVMWDHIRVCVSVRFIGTIASFKCIKSLSNVTLTATSPNFAL